MYGRPSEKTTVVRDRGKDKHNFEPQPVRAVEGKAYWGRIKILTTRHLECQEIEQIWTIDRSEVTQPFHVRLEGLSHVFHNERKEPVVSALQAFFQG